VGDAQVFEHPVGFFLPLGFGERGEFEHAEDVLLHGELPEHRRLLRQVADPLPRPLVHRQAGDLLLVEQHLPRIGLDEADDHIEGRGLARAVRAEKPHDLALLHFEGRAFDHLALVIDLLQVFTAQYRTHS